MFNIRLECDTKKIKLWFQVLENKMQFAKIRFFFFFARSVTANHQAPDEKLSLTIDRVRKITPADSAEVAFSHSS